MGNRPPAKLLTCLLASAFFPPAAWAEAQTRLSSGSGSIEFVASLKSGSVSFLKPQTVLRGSSSDGSERFEAKVAGADLVVIRDVRPCLRLSARVPDAFKTAGPQKISLRWHGASASVSVGGGSEAALEPSRVDELPVFAPALPAIGSPDVEAHGLELNRMAPLSESSSDRRFAEQLKCFNPVSAVQGPLLDSYRGVELRGAADPVQRQQVKRWLGEMTEPMRSAVRIVSVSNAGSETWRGLALSGPARAMLLRPESLSRPGVFFHEGAHLLDASRGWRDSRDWGMRFMGLPAGSPSFSAGAMGHMDASSPGEQLADFVGRSREESLGFAPAAMCAGESACAEKMNFLAVRGYISQADASRLAAGPGSLATPPSALAAAASAPRPSPRLPGATPDDQTETIVPPAGSAAVDILIDSRFFRPMDIYGGGGRTVPLTWRGCKAEDVMNRLTRRRPAAILSEPPLQGVARSYGYFDFGTKKDRRHYFALDERADGSIEMLFDLNGNGRLDDDGPARPNLGKFKDGGKGYATLIEIPWSQMMDNPPWNGNFKLWFMSNPFEWSIAGFSKSSRTQLIGSLRLSGRDYDIVIADGAESDNDGDLTNDGFCLRKTGQKAVCYPDAEARQGVVIDGRRYAFKLRYR